MDQKNILKMPDGGVTDPTEAYVRAMIILPEILSHILEELRSICDTMSVIALYAEKRGVKEGVIDPRTDLDVVGGKDGKD